MSAQDSAWLRRPIRVIRSDLYQAATRERAEARGPRRREPASATAASWAAPRAQLVQSKGLGEWRSRSRDAPATGRAGSRGAPVACAHDRIPFRARCNRRDAARVGRAFSRCTPLLARAGAAARPLLASHDQVTQLVQRSGRDAARAGGAGCRMNVVTRRIRHFAKQIDRGLKDARAR